MEKSYRRMIPFTLVSEAESFWGLTRIMNLEKLVYGEGSSVQSRDRNKAFICTVQASTTRLFYVGGEIAYNNEEFGSETEKFETVRLKPTPSFSETRSPGLASLIIGECYGLGAGASVTNIVVDSKPDLKAVLTICLKRAAQDADSSIVFLENTPSLNDWNNCHSVRAELKAAGIPIIVGASDEYLEGAINVAAVDIHDRALSEDLKVDIFAPGVNIAGLDPNSKRSQIMTGNDVAAAFVAGVALLHLSGPEKIKLEEKIINPASRIKHKNSYVPMLWNPYQIFEPTWDYTQDAFLGAFAWNQKVEIPLKLINSEGRDVAVSFVHNDLPQSLTLEKSTLVGTMPDGQGTHCHHFVVTALNGGSAASKMFYLTVTDEPQILDLDNYRNLNIVAKTVAHYGGGDPNPPSFPPYHSITASCVTGDTLISVGDERKKIRIDQLRAGDKVVNKYGELSEVNERLDRILDGRPLYSINGGLLIVTGCHWLMGLHGTTAVEASGFDFDGLPVNKLEVGSYLKMANQDFIKVESIETLNGFDRYYPVYNVITNDDAGYCCNGVLSATEISTKRLFAKDPAVKGQMLNHIFKQRMQNEN